MQVLTFILMIDKDVSTRQNFRLTQMLILILPACIWINIIINIASTTTLIARTSSTGTKRKFAIESNTKTSTYSDNRSGINQYIEEYD